MNDALSPWTVRPEPARDRWGRYQIVPATGTSRKPVPHTRVTTIASTLSDERNLTLWKMRTVVTGLAQRPDLIEQAALATARRELDQIADAALTAGDLKKAASRGTSLHRWTELADLGELPDQHPLAPTAHLEAWRTGLAHHGLTVRPEHIEQICVLPAELLGEPIAGTCDRFLQRPDGTLVIADLKTGGFHDWMKYAIQLACYARAATLWAPGVEKHQPMPTVDIDTALVLLLPQDETLPTLEIVEVDIAAGWEAAKLAVATRSARRATWHRPIIATYPTRDDVHQLVEQIKAARPDTAQQLLRAWWPTGMPTLREYDAHTPDQLHAAHRALIRLAAEIELPW